MILSKITTAVAVLAASCVAAQAFDWSSKLAQSPSALKEALGTSATCDVRGFSVPVDYVDADTTITPSFPDPVVNKDFKVAVVGSDDVSVDRDKDRRYRAEMISTLSCLIGREATATAYVFDEKIFRIGLQYDRCKTRNEETMLDLKDFKFMKCRGADIEQRPFDTALYDEVISKNPHGERTGYDWVPFLKGDYAQAERDLVYSLKCDGNDETKRRLSARNDSWRCWIAINNSDISRWSSATMFEFYEKGFFSDDIHLRLASTRHFVDLPAEQAAVKAMLPDLQTMIDDIKKTIADRVNAQKSKENAVSDILGAGN